MKTIENLRKIENESIRLYLQKYLLINKLNNLHIKQHYYRLYFWTLIWEQVQKVSEYEI